MSPSLAMLEEEEPEPPLSPSLTMLYESKCKAVCVPCDDASDALSEASTAPKRRKGECELCGKTFQQAGHLKRHMAHRHGQGMQWHFCKAGGCNYKCKRADNLKRHMAHRHGQGMQWHFCEAEGCDYKCKQADNLKRHMADRHGQGVQWHFCKAEGCDYKCKQADNLKRHMAYMHDEGVNWHVCDVGKCRKQFKSRSNLMMHIDRCHNEEFVRRKKQQEERVRAALVAAGYREWFATANVPPVGFFKREKRIDFRCAGVQSKTAHCRIDFVLSLRGGLVFLEVDENQHQYGYDASISCDMKRMSHVMESLFVELGEALPKVYWLRYNPNACRVDGDLVRVPKEERERRLVRWLEAFEATAPLQIGYAFYDSEDGELEVLSNKEYSPHLAEVAEDLGQLEAQ